jgi:uncharacterized membrane protein YkoI
MKTNHKSQTGAVGVLEAIGVVLVVSVIGFGVWRVVNNDSDSNTPVASQNETSEVLPADLEEALDFAAVQTIAQEQSSSELVSYELEYEDGRLVYKLYFADGVSIRIDALSGQVLGQGTDDNEDTGGAIPVGFVPGITVARAVEIARGQFPDVEVEKVELELEDGGVVYSVRFVNDERVDVSAVDGDILRVKDAEGTETVDNRKNDDRDDDGSDEDSYDDSNDEDDDEEDDDSDEDRDDDDNDEDEDDSSDNSGSGSQN